LLGSEQWYPSLLCLILGVPANHIRPRSLFKYNSPEDSEFKECWVLKNLQPLEKTANLRKSNTV